MKTFIDLMKDKELEYGKEVDGETAKKIIRKHQANKDEVMMLYGLGVLTMLLGIFIG